MEARFLAQSNSEDISVSPRFSKGLASACLSDHVSKHSKHGSTSIVELDIKLACLEFRIGNVLTEPTNPVVSIVLGGRHPCELNKCEEEKKLEKSSRRDGRDSSEDLSTNARSVDIREFDILGLGNVSVENNAIGMDNLSNQRHHADTSMFALNGTATLKGFGLSVEPSKGIVDTKGLSDSELKLIYHVHRSCDLGLVKSRGERDGGADEEGCDGELHLKTNDLMRIDETKRNFKSKHLACSDYSFVGATCHRSNDVSPLSMSRLLT